MAKYVPFAVLDAMLDIVGAADRLFVCSIQPTTYAQASSIYNLATKILSGAFSKANGDISGRKLVLAAQSGISVTTEGNAQHWALGKSDTSELLLVGTLTAQMVYVGNTVNFPQTDVLEIRDVS